ncbi:MAG TPA: adenylate/guanylate cyclase domain-containing protein [Chitinophagaceae bacterium]|nr:adenylate/guanylate cyclase domain-containing protein [Chitinophagaceae bacterium]
MKHEQVKWPLIKHVGVVAILLSTLTTYKVLESPVQLQTQFMIELAGWHLGSLVVIMWTAQLMERRLLCDWFRCSFLKIAASRMVVYLLISSLIASAEVVYYNSLLPGFTHDNLFWSSLIFYALVYFITTVAMEVSKLVGKGFTEKLILGNYHLPKKESRIFLFIDLKESTKLSKELSLDNYSFLIKEFFRDIDRAMEKFDGEIYQYAGDEVIVSWLATNTNYEKAVRSFIEFYEQMKAKRSHYIKRYGVAPVFKAAIHSGNVIATWMGRMKRELVFHGEVLNTTARLTSLAKNLSYPILLTKQVVDQLSDSLREHTLEGGSYFLKGLNMPVAIYILALGESAKHMQENSQPMEAISNNNLINSF